VYSYRPLIALEAVNDQCRSTLTKLLFNRHRVRIGSAAGDLEKTGTKGSAWFAAFDPWNTCWRAPPGSFSLFHVAERQGVITPDESLHLRYALLCQAADIARNYHGRFSFYFHEPRVQFLLRHSKDPGHLADTGLAIASSVVDYLVEKCPWPILPKRQLEAIGFRDIHAIVALQVHAQLPWLTWAESLDMVSVGPLLGLRAEEILSLLDSINRLARGNDTGLTVTERSLGQRVVIPLFAGGLQGRVVGLFHEIAEEQRDPIHTTLLEFGQTLADAYAEMRLNAFAAALKMPLVAEDLAKEAVYAFSPVGKIVAETKQGQAGFKLCNEHNYWAGYQQLSREEALDRSSPQWFTLRLPQDVLIHIEPLADVPHFDPDFFRLRLESGFRRVFGPLDGAAVSDGLSIHEVQRRLRELAAYMEDGKPSFAKMRQYFVAQQVERDLAQCGTRITNMRLKGFLEERTGTAVRTGYQISSYQTEVERVFPGKLKVEKTRYGVSLSWKTTP
jgi:hypothetical protein